MVLNQESVKNVTQATFWIKQLAKIVPQQIILKTVYSVADPMLSAWAVHRSFTCTKDNVNHVLMKLMDARVAITDFALNVSKDSDLTRPKMNVKNVALLCPDALSALILLVPNVLNQNLLKTPLAKVAYVIKNKAGQNLITIAYANHKFHTPTKTKNKIA